MILPLKPDLLPLAPKLLTFEGGYCKIILVSNAVGDIPRLYARTIG